VVHKLQYHALERKTVVPNFVTMLSREGGTKISLPYSREEVVLKFQYQALEGLWYLNFNTVLSRGGGT